MGQTGTPSEHKVTCSHKTWTGQTATPSEHKVTHTVTKHELVRQAHHLNTRSHTHSQHMNWSDRHTISTQGHTHTHKTWAGQTGARSEHSHKIWTGQMGSPSEHKVTKHEQVRQAIIWAHHLNTRSYIQSQHKNRSDRHTIWTKSQNMNRSDIHTIWTVTKQVRTGQTGIPSEHIHKTWTGLTVNTVTKHDLVRQA